MKLAIFSALLLLGRASSAPSSNDETWVLNDDIFLDDFKVYESEHDIVNICVPLNSLNFYDGNFSTIFFVSRDNEEFLRKFKENSKNLQTADQGLYIKQGSKITKLLHHGRDIAVPIDGTNRAFFATINGVYAYDADKNSAESYGEATTGTDLVGIVVGRDLDTMYVLSADKHVYKVSEDGTLIKMDDVKNAEQIVLDYGNNLFYVDSSNKLFVFNADGTKQIEGLPENAKITLIKPYFALGAGIPVVADKDMYKVYANGTVEYKNIKIDTEITAYSIEGMPVQYYAHKKKIYRYNDQALVHSSFPVIKYIGNIMNNAIEAVVTN